jgi:serine/threonine protein kinase
VRDDTDHYETLEVHPRASPAVIEAAYRALMKRHHPDIKKTDRVARRLNAAYAVLSDKEARARYDHARAGAVGESLGEFRVESLIAEGGFGKTYKGRHLIVGEPVCIKHCSEISAADAAILREEAKAMWDLRHYAIPAVRNLLRLPDGSLALVMSYIEGPTLEQVIEKYQAKKKRLEPEAVAWITQRILNALSYIHRHGVVHGDLKPQNIIVQPTTHAAVLVDFGLAAIKPTRATKNKGYTELFSPPEQLSEDAPLIPETDFYSLGMTMIYALAGGDADHTRRKELPADVPEPLRRFIQRLVVRHPLDRPRWEKEDLIATLETARREAFGRTISGMIPLDI